ncbi:MAG TPA: hypothetical protein VFW98_01025 [Gemmatimonadaceae bacterium]|nr:hypothetical protein [Gemmatimonadaceae bacterium]
MAAPKPGDLPAGYVGLIVVAIFLLVVLTGIVHLTNAHYAGEAPAKAAATK